MKLVFLSNYFTHHQKPLSDALAELTEFAFIETVPMTEERMAMGWGMAEQPEYVCRYELQKDRAEELLRGADAVIVGSAPENLVSKCIRRGQLVVRYAERPLKKGSEWHKYIPRLMKWHLQNPVGKPVFLLCASGYTSADYAKFGLFRNRAFRWGYFPESRCYADIGSLVAQKTEGSLLWAGRFLDWKHPDDAIRVAARLKADGIPFTLNIIGQGPLEEKLRQMIREENLQDCVRLLGSMKPEQVRLHMEQSGIFLFTSDRQEGWGAVLNEAMNSGCAVVACRAAGSVPYLVRDGENGSVYPGGDPDALYRQVRLLLEDPEKQRNMGIEAYRTIQQEWNAECAAQRLIALLEGIRAENLEWTVFEGGPCSRAPRIRK